jgi:hypothetical protein
MNKQDEGMQRREFLRKAGLGSVALAAAPMFGHLLAPPAMGGASMHNFALVALTGADTTDGRVHRIGLQGSGVFHPHSKTVRGGGSFEYFDAGPPGVPKPILGSATWRARKVIKFTSCVPGYTCTTPGGTTAGRITPSVVDMAVDIAFNEGPKIKGAWFRLICNVGFAGIINIDPDTGEPLPEGYFLTFTHPDYGTLEFKPLDPIIGITHIGSFQVL